MSGLRGKRYRRPELPLVPLIDVLVMLVLFSFVTMRFTTSRTMNITVPKAETAGKNQLTGSVEIAVDKEGKIFVNGKETPEQSLEALLKQIQAVNRDTPVLLRADETSQFGKVMLLLDTCRKIGLSKVVMQARK